MTGRDLVPTGHGRVQHPAMAEHPVASPFSRPSMMFARSFSGRPLAFATDVPLELRGGDRLGPSGILCDLDMIWQPGFMSAVEAACADQRIRGREWFSMPPLLLGGPDGAGRTHVARRLALAAGVPHIHFDVSCDMFARPRMGPDVPVPLPIAAAMLASGCANPVVSVTGADGLSDPMALMLSRLVDRDTNDRFVDEANAAVFDFSAVTWCVQTHDRPAAEIEQRGNFSHAQPGRPAGVPRIVTDRLARVDLREAESEHYCLLVIDVLAEALSDRGIQCPRGLDLRNLFATAERWRDRTTAQIYARLADLVEEHSRSDHPQQRRSEDEDE